MTSGIVRPISDQFVLDRFADCQAALLNRDLSRTFDDRSFEEGNVRAGVLSTSHGALHRSRRRLENTLFRSERLELYERKLFPEVIDRLLVRLVDDGRADLHHLAEMLGVELSAHRTGVDHEPDDLDQLRWLVDFVDRYSQGTALVDTVGDADAVRALVKAALADLDAYVAPARARREELLARWRAGELDEAGLPNDILTLLLRHRDDAEYGLDDGIILRETATYLHAGTATSATTIVNTTDLLLTRSVDDPAVWERVAEDRAFAQRCVHEALRLRPTTPRMKRRAEVATPVGEHGVPADGLVIIDAGAANRDPEVFGPTADVFDPDRAVPERAHRWGLSFGAGAHQCPGRNVAGGFPATADGGDVGDQHLYGLVALMLQGVARLRPQRDPEHPPRRDTRTERHTRWGSYPVLLRAR